MGYKFRQGAMLIAGLFMITILGIVLLANRKNTSPNRANNTSSISEEENTENQVTGAELTFFGGTNVGSDLDAWKTDPLFWNEAKETVVDKPLDVSGSDVSGSDISGNDVSGNDVSGSDVSGSDSPNGKKDNISDSDALKEDPDNIRSSASE